MEKIVQTAGRNALGEFAPEFAHFNDDVLLVKTGIIVSVKGKIVQVMQAT